MKLILVRHGESARNRGYEVKSEENNLTAEGVTQAIEVAKKLAKKNFGVIYCSPTNRCEQTLDEILRVKDGNQPIYMCQLVGPKMKREKFEEVKKRVEIFVDDLRHDHEDSETVLVIGHKMVLAMMTYVISGEKREFGNGELFEVVL